MKALFFMKAEKGFSMYQDMKTYDVTVIGAGPAGLGAAKSAYENGAKTLLIEREARLGGILKQCIHDGFGLLIFKEKLTGPEYAQRYIDMINKTSIDISLLTYVTDVKKNQDGFYHITMITQKGIKHILSKTIILATGCRERTAKQIFIHGTRPSGVFTAGTAQYYTNILGHMPTKKCVILGSGDIGMIMARRLTLEGAKVEGVYEVKSELGGLMRNYSQCLIDYNIPLYTNKTVTKVFGEKRLTAVEISSVNDDMSVIEGSQKIVDCDALILSVGLIPENELAEKMEVPIDEFTKGPIADQCNQTLKDGIFICGNAHHVNDLVDYVSKAGITAGRCAANYVNKERKLVKLQKSDLLSYCVPQYIDKLSEQKNVDVYFRSKARIKDVRVSVTADNRVIATKRLVEIRPAEIETIQLDLSKAGNDILDIFLSCEKV